MCFLRRSIANEQGSTAVEYALMAGIMAVVLVITSEWMGWRIAIQFAKAAMYSITTETPP